MSKKKSDTLKKVILYIKPYLFLLILSVIFSAVTVAFTLYVPILIGQAIDLILGKGNVDFKGIAEIAAKTGVIIVGIALACEYD